MFLFRLCREFTRVSLYGKSRCPKLKSKETVQNDRRREKWIPVDREQDTDSLSHIRGIVSGIRFINSSVGFITVSTNHKYLLYKTMDGGITWKGISPPTPNTISGVKSWISSGIDSKVIKVETTLVNGLDESMYIYTTADGGETWKQDIKTNKIVSSFCMVNQIIGYGVSTNPLNKKGILYRTEDGGGIWHPAD